MFDQIIHRYFRVPYTLHVHSYRRVKRARATVLFIHGIGMTGAEWAEVEARLPEDVSIMSIDLLGFGQSAQPVWASYDATTQARSVIATLLKYFRPPRPLIIVGHSLGALVAIEVARRYPLLVRSLVLCSPPLYRADQRRMIAADKILAQFYSSLESRPEELLKLSRLVFKYKLVNKAFNLTEHNVMSYRASLRAAIMNQTSYEDIKRVIRPTTIIYGTLDPFVIEKNLKSAAKLNPKLHLRRALIGHEITTHYAKVTAKEIVAHVDRAYGPRKK